MKRLGLLGAILAVYSFSVVPASAQQQAIEQAQVSREELLAALTGFATKTQKEQKAEAIWSAEQVVAAGSKPQAWPNRAFLPNSVVRSFGQTLVGTEYVLPNGSIDAEGRARGFFHIELVAFELTPKDGLLTAELKFKARYKADLEKSWWRSAKIDLSVEAQLIPAGNGLRDDEPVMYFRLAPTSIRPAFSLKLLSLKSGKLLSQLLARGAIEAFGDAALLPVAIISEPMSVKTSVDSLSYSKFQTSGGFYLRISHAGPTYASNIVADRALVTSSGIWLLGGTAAVPPSPKPPSSSGELATWINQHEGPLVTALNPFKLPGELVRVHVGKGLVDGLAVSFAQDVAANRFQLGIDSQEATGKIADQYLLKDNLLGDVGLTVTPTAPDFVKGSVGLAFGPLNWVPGTGLTSTVAANLQLRADVHAHLSTAFVGGGVGKDIRIRGEAQTATTATLKIERRASQAGNAVVLSPEIACAGLAAEIRPENLTPVIDEPWFKLSTLGVRIRRNIGDQAQKPSILFTSLPQFIAFVKRKPATAGAPQEVERLRFRSAGLSLTLDPQDATVDSDGLDLTASVAITNAERPDPEEVKKAMEGLREAIEGTQPKPVCDVDQKLELLVGDYRIGGSNDIVAFIVKMINAGQVVSETTIKEVENLYHKPIDTLRNTPENVIREGERAVDNFGREISTAGKKVKKECKKRFGKKWCKWI